MPNESRKKNRQLVLPGPGGLGRIHVDTEAFFELSFWLAEELEDLVAQWSHKATEQSNRIRPELGENRGLRRP